LNYIVGPVPSHLQFEVFDSVKNEFMGEVLVKFEDLERYKVINDWYPLRNKSDTSENIGDIRLSFLWQRAIILNDIAYEQLLIDLMDKKLSLVKKLSEVSFKKEKVVAECLVKAFEVKKSAVHLIKELCAYEIENTNDPSLFFRANTVPTKSVDMYMRLNGSEYLKQALLDIIRQIASTSAKKKVSICELDPFRLEHIREDKREKVRQKNLKNLKLYVSLILESIKEVTSRCCPTHFRNIFESIKTQIDNKFPGDIIARNRAIGGFIFLRFFLSCSNIPKEL